RRELLRSRWRWLLAAAALAVVLAAPWYLAMAQHHGAPFVGRFFGTENVGEFRFPWTVEGEGSVLLALPIPFLPWAPPVRARGPGRSSSGRGCWGCSPSTACRGSSIHTTSCRRSPRWRSWRAGRGRAGDGGEAWWFSSASHWRPCSRCAFRSTLRCCSRS